MLSDINWKEVEPAGEMLPVGGYVLRIMSAKETEASGYQMVEIVYDVAEGEYKGYYFSKKDWMHTMNVFTTDKDGNPQGGFRTFLDFLEKDNPKFKMEKLKDASQLEGLIFGGCIQKSHYTNQKGEDKYSLKVLKRVSADDIRKGNYEMPEEDDRRKNKTEATSAATVTDADEYTGDVPF